MNKTCSPLSIFVSVRFKSKMFYSGTFLQLKYRRTKKQRRNKVILAMILKWLKKRLSFSATYTILDNSKVIKKIFDKPLVIAIWTDIVLDKLLTPCMLKHLHCVEFELKYDFPYSRIQVSGRLSLLLIFWLRYLNGLFVPLPEASQAFHGTDQDLLIYLQCLVINELSTPTKGKRNLCSGYSILRTSNELQENLGVSVPIYIEPK